MQLITLLFLLPPITTTPAKKSLVSITIHHPATFTIRTLHFFLIVFSHSVTSFHLFILAHSRTSVKQKKRIIFSLSFVGFVPPQFRTVQDATGGKFGNEF